MNAVAALEASIVAALVAVAADAVIAPQMKHAVATRAVRHQQLGAGCGKSC
jgi:hypothetical protein